MTSMTRPQELDARGRRLRAALAAILARDDALVGCQGKVTIEPSPGVYAAAGR